MNKWGPIPTTQTHNIFTHFPKCKDCAICNQTKVQRAQCRQSSGQPDGLPEPVSFGDALTADHAIINEDDMPRSFDRAALIVLDRATRWIQAYPAPSKNAEQTSMALQRFMGPGNKPKFVWHTTECLSFRRSDFLTRRRSTFVLQFSLVQLSSGAVCPIRALDLSLQQKQKQKHC